MISFSDVNNQINNVTYTTTVVTGDNDNLLEAGELLEVSIDLTQAAFGTNTIGTNQTFSLEVKPPSGSYLVVQRTTPASINQSVINLN